MTIRRQVQKGASAAAAASSSSNPSAKRAVVALAFATSLAHGDNRVAIVSESADGIALRGGKKEAQQQIDGTEAFVANEEVAAVASYADATVDSDDKSPVARSLQDFQYFETTTDTSRALAGMMFNIKAQKRIILRAMKINLTRETEVQVWVKMGNYKGYQMDQSAWTLWVKQTIAPAGNGALTEIPPGIFPRMAVEKGEMRAFYVHCPVGACLRYAEEGYQRYSNDDIIMLGNGSAKQKGWQGAFVTPRTWSGALEYEAEEDSEPAVNFLLGFGPPPTTNPTSRPTRQPTNLPTKSPTPPVAALDGTFRLRLTWEADYFWQETRRETKWCMQASSSTNEIYIQWCGDSSRQKFVRIGDTFRPASNTNLCFTHTGFGTQNRPIRLMTCDSTNANQQFDLRGGEDRYGNDDKNRFQIHPRNGSNICLTQDHHPKAYERVYPEYCAEAYRDDTSFWNTY